ncbi:hypothetical protein ACQGSX_14045 [Bacillus sp. GMs2/1]
MKYLNLLIHQAVGKYGYDIVDLTGGAGGIIVRQNREVILWQN